MSQESTAGHGPSKGYSKMNDRLKEYFKEKGMTSENPHLPNASANHAAWARRKRRKRKSVK